MRQSSKSRIPNACALIDMSVFGSVSGQFQFNGLISVFYLRPDAIRKRNIKLLAVATCALRQVNFYVKLKFLSSQLLHQVIFYVNVLGQLNY